MPLTMLEKEFVAACCEVPPNFEKAKELLSSGVDINGKDDYGESFVEQIALGYPQESVLCINCEAETCEGCLQNDTTYLPKVCGRTISQITFAHNKVIKGSVHYGQPTINLHLDDDTVISFTHNYGEMPKGEYISRFSITHQGP